MSFGIYFLGVPIIEGPEAKLAREKEQTEKLAIRKDAQVDKVELRNEQQAISSIARNYGTGETPVEGVFSDAADLAGEITPSIINAASPFAGLSSALGGLGGLFGGGSSSAPDLTPLLLIGGLGLGAVVLLSSDDGKGRR